MMNKIPVRFCDPDGTLQLKISLTTDVNDNLIPTAKSARMELFLYSCDTVCMCGAYFNCKFEFTK